jgi:AAA+ ATPase superfamily predicted ATPase
VDLKMRFINRDKELAVLEKDYKRKDSSFTVIYGRRRVGKTTLIKEFIKDKTALYFLADKQTEVLQINRFKSIYAEQFNDDALKNLEANSWDHIFNYIIKHLSLKKKLIIVIDEFQYLVKVNRAVPSIFQRIWDDLLKTREIMLILCGSLISMMYSATLSYASPLYGRRTSQLKLSSMKFAYFKDFFKEKSAVRLIERYAILSGVPKYIEIFEDHEDIFQAIAENILEKDSFLYQEPVFILNEEVGETTTYFSILEVISRGEHKIGNIAARLQIPTNHITSFLNRLIELEMVEREVPITENNPTKSKKGLYFIKDHFFRFWFRYVLPYKSYIEIENRKFVLEKIKESFHVFVSQAFEKVCMEYLLENPPLEIQKIGRWWDNREEIDIAAVSETEMLLGECKWWDNQVGINVLEDLQRKAAFIDHEGKELYFAIFAKNGFTGELEEEAKNKKNIFLYDFSRIC